MIKGDLKEISIMKIDITAIVGFLTVLCSFAVKFIGFPAQFQKIRKTKTIEGLSISLFAIAFVSYILWTLYGILKNDIVTILGQGVGIIVTGAILVQMYRFRNNNKADNFNKES